MCNYIDIIDTMFSASLITFKHQYPNQVFCPVLFVTLILMLVSVLVCTVFGGLALAGTMLDDCVLVGTTFGGLVLVGTVLDGLVLVGTRFDELE